MVADRNAHFHYAHAEARARTGKCAFRSLSVQDQMCFGGAACPLCGEAGFAAELLALGAAFFELAAGRSADLVDPACVGAVLGAEVNAGAVRARREADHAEVARLDRVGDVRPSDLAPKD